MTNFAAHTEEGHNVRNRLRLAQRENRNIHIAQTEERQTAGTSLSAQMQAKRTMKERFRHDLYEANARSLNISNLYKKYEGEL